MDEVEMMRREDEFVSHGAENRYIANFHLIEAYHIFAKYQQRFAYTEVVEWIEVNSQTLNTFKLMSEFSEEGNEKPQTPLRVATLSKLKMEPIKMKQLEKKLVKWLPMNCFLCTSPCPTYLVIIIFVAIYLFCIPVSGLKALSCNIFINE